MNSRAPSDLISFEWFTKLQKAKLEFLFSTVALSIQLVKRCYDGILACRETMPFYSEFP